MSVLIDLGHYLFLNLVVTWFSVEDVCKFDTATTNHNNMLRTKFLQFIKSKIITLHSTDLSIVNETCIKWIGNREVYVDCLVVYSKILSKTVDCLNPCPRLKIEDI
jgi:hypothetical protein